MNPAPIRLSVIVITHNEERNIVECLRSVSWADELIVVDSQSTDRTVELARTMTHNVFVQEWMGYGGMKNFALGKCHQEWVLWVDADERVPVELQEEIKSIVRSADSGHSAYEV
ncbi:MAG TPA: glycosyltransferase family 2 protein, partial [Bacteroidota bacterium]|nr:glycosyltransferase family 2 protein [Bacteroidota bacterium]